MDSVVFDLGVITPLFMAGANKNTAELRPSSFKGMIRFWWRAMRAKDDIKKLAEEEARIFGGTGEGQKKSDIIIIISQKQDLTIGDDFLSEVGFQKENKRITRSEDAGLGYLFYSTYTLRDRGQPILRKYIRPNQKFSLEIRGKSKSSMEKVMASFWLAVNFGGFGTRARRGGGNLAVLDLKGPIPDSEELRRRFIAHDDIQSFMQTGYTWAKDIIEQERTGKYSNLSDSTILIGSAHSNTDWKVALNSIGKIYKEYRSNIKRDLFAGPHFGIPVMHNRFKTRLVGYQNETLLTDRRSSPLIFKLIKFKERYFPIVIKLGGLLLPHGAVIMKEIKKDRWSASNDNQYEDSSVVDELLDCLIAEGFTEVQL